MADSVLLAPVAGDDPCGPDLRWDSEFLQLGSALDEPVSQGEEAVVDGQVARADIRSFDEIIDMAMALSARTKDVRVLAIRSEASWHRDGLAAFAAAMEDLTAVLEAWPGPADGVHPRADESDGDLGERAAALGRLLKRIPVLAATIGWGAKAGSQARIEGSATLRGVFGAWRERLEPACGADLPSPTDAWRSLRELVVGADVSDGEAATPGDPGAPPPVADAWDLIDRAVEQLGRQDRHSPAVPVLRLLLRWRSLDLVEIADLMKASGLTLEQLLDSVKKQTREG